MLNTPRLLTVPLIPVIALLVANVSILADETPPARKEVLSTDTLVTQVMVESALDLPCPNLQFTGEHPLTDFLEVFEAHWGKHVAHDLRFFPDHPELDLEGIASLTAVMIRDIKIAAGTHTCRDALDLIFTQTTDPELTYQPVPGHIDVTTLSKAESEKNLLSRVYNMSEFLSGNPAGNVDRPTATKKGRKKKNRSAKQTQQEATAAPQQVLKQFGHGGGGFGGGFSGGSQPSSSGATHESTDDELSMGTLIQLLQEQTSPPAKWFMIDGEGGQISTLGQYLVVRQTPVVHREIEDILTQLRTAIKAGGVPYVVPGSNFISGGISGGGNICDGGPGPGFFQVDD